MWTSTANSGDSEVNPEANWADWNPQRKRSSKKLIRWVRDIPRFPRASHSPTIYPLRTCSRIVSIASINNSILALLQLFSKLLCVMQGCGENYQGHCDANE